MNFPRKQGVVKWGLINNELWALGHWLTSREIRANTKNNGPGKLRCSNSWGGITSNPVLTLPTAPEVLSSLAYCLYPTHQLPTSHKLNLLSPERTLMGNTTSQQLAQLLVPPLSKTKRSTWVAHGWSFLAGAQYGMRGRIPIVAKYGRPLRITSQSELSSPQHSLTTSSDFVIQHPKR